MFDREISEAAERLADQRLLERGNPLLTIEEMADAWTHKCRLRDDPERRRALRRRFDAWVDENSR